MILLIFMAIIGLIVQIIQWQYDSHSKYYCIFGAAFGFLTTCWSSVMLFGWKRQEKVFQIKFGQGQDSDDLMKQEQNDRPGFKGQYRRSIINDNLNDNFTFIIY
ncbi:hypothetical protein PPERSA_13005 [Pseudocohnilembus persalinus]|uniref:Anoctamin transmembrane domain-containing protein n=1 Tax=Pseudocohnilembus persalinus TaxID=266149 RepID=A0A0V0R1Y0_PSEPJ|nr:hypothetical protein PPERSA_13005 [Pseudocohnilembus persalinus]|eukprot:KRX08524.1 hypothetical protein PPERSA_13005 [Pseudocohnilembus persalinus]